MEDRTRRLCAYQEEARSCVRCREHGLLFRHDDGRFSSPLFQRDPTGAAGVLVVAEAPNLADTFDPEKGYLTYDAETDPTGRAACGLLGHAGLAVEDVLFTNAVLCLPSRLGGRYPVGARQVDLCRPWLVRLVEVAEPDVVVTFGAVPLAALGRVERHGLRLFNAVGRLHPWHGRRLLPLYHPGVLGRISRSAKQQRRDVEALRNFLVTRGSRGGGG